LGEEGALKASVLVRDSRPLRVSASLDNTGSDSTGEHRLGIALQHANLFDRDHVGTVAYTTSPERQQDVHVFSLGYRVPFYALGDSLDLVYGRSDVDAATSQTVAGPLDFSGEGSVFAVRYNHYFARAGEYSSRLTVGWERRHYRNACDIGGVSCGAADADVTVRPLSLSYIGRQAGAEGSLDYHVTLAHNIPGSGAGSDADFDRVRAGADAGYTLGRLGATLVRDLGTWRGRLAIEGQYAAEPLVPGEQFGLAGTGAVRGFDEREVATDSGVVANLELFTPSASLPIAADPATLRGVLFLDAASGHNRDVQPGTLPRNVTLASVGVGLRGEWRNNASLSLDVARVVQSHAAADSDSGDLRAHFAINVLF
jgi:hemolysin activation/secretion protein